MGYYNPKPDDLIYATALGFRLQRYISDEIDDIYNNTSFSYAAIYRDILKSWCDNRIRQRKLKERQQKHQDIMRRIRSRKFNLIRQCIDAIRMIEEDALYPDE